MGAINTLQIGFKNWKTTLISVLLAIVYQMQNTADLTNWREWVFPSLIAIFGVLQRDADKSSENSGIKTP